MEKHKIVRLTLSMWEFETADELCKLFAKIGNTRDWMKLCTQSEEARRFEKIMRDRRSSRKPRYGLLQPRGHAQGVSQKSVLRAIECSLDALLVAEHLSKKKSRWSALIEAEEGNREFIGEDLKKNGVSDEVLLEVFSDFENSTPAGLAKKLIEEYAQHCSSETHARDRATRIFKRLEEKLGSPEQAQQ